MRIPERKSTIISKKSDFNGWTTLHGLGSTSHAWIPSKQVSWKMNMVGLDNSEGNQTTALSRGFKLVANRIQAYKIPTEDLKKILFFL